ncbi:MULTISPECIES: DUF975 family protein [Exiguobacterium]|uniref:DUF975 family protein n=1 Tax=Exiguobacterium TaxID=33986 RepID=UPI001BE584A2|nr:DUF975 family protein [Exiguobacterium sp. s56]
MVQTWNDRARTAIKGKTGTLILWSFVCSIVLEVGLMMDPYYYGFEYDTLALTLISLAGLILYAGLLPVLVGYNWVMLETIRGKSMSLRDILTPFRHRYVKHLLASLLVMLFQVLWSLLLLVPGIVKYFSYAFTFFILRDEPDLSITEAITKSRTLMRGRKWEAFKLILPFIPLFLVGLTFFISIESVILGSLIYLVAIALIRPFIVSRFAVMYEDTRREYDEQWNRSA